MYRLLKQTILSLIICTPLYAECIFYYPSTCKILDKQTIKAGRILYYQVKADCGNGSPQIYEEITTQPYGYRKTLKCKSLEPEFVCHKGILPEDMKILKF